MPILFKNCFNSHARLFFDAPLSPDYRQLHRIAVSSLRSTIIPLCKTFLQNQPANSSMSHRQYSSAIFDDFHLPFVAVNRGYFILIAWCSAWFRLIPIQLSYYYCSSYTHPNFSVHYDMLVNFGDLWPYSDFRNWAAIKFCASDTHTWCA